MNIAPQQGWLGYCNVTVSLNDSIKSDTDTFKVTVVRVRGNNYLPIILE